MAKRKRRKRKNRVSKIKLVLIETPTEQRKKFPKELIGSFLNLDETQVLGTEFDFKYHEWTEEAYELYAIEARKYLGDKANDRLESGRLVVLLSKATMDLRDGKKTKKEQTEKN